MTALQNMAIINNSSEKSSLIIEIGMARSRTRVQMQNARDQKNGRYSRYQEEARNHFIMILSASL